MISFDLFVAFRRFLVLYVLSCYLLVRMPVDFGAVSWANHKWGKVS